MTGDYAGYRRDIELLSGLQASLEQGLDRVKSLGDSDLRHAEDQLSQVKAQTQKAEHILREATARLERANAGSGLTTAVAPAAPSAPPSSVARPTSQSVAEIVKDLTTLSRDLDRIERSVDWVREHRPQVVAADVNRSANSRSQQVFGSASAEAGAGLAIAKETPRKPLRSGSAWFLVGAAVLVIFVVAIALGA